MNNSINTLDKVKKFLERKFKEYQKEEIFSETQFNFNFGEKNAVREIYIAIFGKEEFDKFISREKDSEEL